MLLLRHTRRREFIAALGGAAAAGRSRRVRSSRADTADRRADGLCARATGRTSSASRHSGEGFSSRLDGGPQRADRYIAGRDGRCDRLQQFATELVALQPDVILATARPTTGALLQATAHDTDRLRQRHPIRSAQALSRACAAGRQRHRVCRLRIRLSGKWLELLKEIAPHADRVGVLLNPSNGAVCRILPKSQAAAPSLRAGGDRHLSSDAPSSNRVRCEHLRATPNGGLIVTASDVP